MDLQTITLPGNNIFRVMILSSSEVKQWSNNVEICSIPIMECVDQWFPVALLGLWNNDSVVKAPFMPDMLALQTYDL